MNVEIGISKEHQEFVQSLVAAGRFASVDEAISEAIRLLIATERLRREVQVGIDQADRDDLHDHETVFSQLRAIATRADQQ